MEKILVAVDNSDHSQKVLAEAAKFAAALDAEVELLTVYLDFPSKTPQLALTDLGAISTFSEDTINENLEKAAEKLREKGIEVKTVVGKGHPAQVICDYVKKGNYSYVVIGNRGLGGLSEFMLGSISNRVANCAETAIIIIK